MVFLAGYEGSLEPVAPLPEEELFGAGKASPSPLPRVDDSVGETPTTPLQDHAGEVLAELGELSKAQGLSLFVKLGLAGVILAACYGWIRAHSPRTGLSLIHI